MRKILAIGALTLMGGCASVKEGLNDAKETVTNPPDQVWEAVQYLLSWLIEVGMDFFLGLASKIGL